jgi:hypothetical protein
MSVSLVVLNKYEVRCVSLCSKVCVYLESSSNWGLGSGKTLILFSVRFCSPRFVVLLFYLSCWVLKFEGTKDHLFIKPKNVQVPSLLSGSLVLVY